MFPLRGVWRSGNLRTTRIEAFSDGVFAIVCTLLVLNLGVPHVRGLDPSRELAELMLQLTPKLVCYAVSFCIVAIYWVAHYHLFHIVRKSDRGLLWLNSLFLMFLAFLPFPTALVSEYPLEPLAIRWFAGSMALTRVSFLLMRWHVSYGARLIDPRLDPLLVRRSMIRSLANPVLYSTAALLAPSFTGLALGLCAAIPFLYFVPSRLERHEGKDRPA